LALLSKEVLLLLCAHSLFLPQAEYCLPFNADFRMEMSPFGAVYTLLEAWPTESTRAYLVSEDGADRQLRQSQILGTSQQMLKTMSTIFARVVPSIVREMQIRVPRSAVEKHLYELLASMHFPTPIPAIKVMHRSCLQVTSAEAAHIVSKHVFLSWAAGCMHKSNLQTSRYQIILCVSIC